MAHQFRARKGGGDDPLARGLQLQQAGDLAAAEREYRRLKRKDRRYGEALRMRALIAQQRGDNRQAIKLLQRALAEQPANPVFHHTLAEMLRVDEDLEAAITSYRRAWKLQPERSATGVDLAETLVRAGHVAQAIKIWHKLLRNAANPGHCHSQIALLQQRLGKRQESRETLQLWREQMPETADNWNDLGRAYAAIGQPREAADCQRAALALAPDHAAACAGLGSALQLQGQLDEAAQWFERALALQPDLGWVYPALMAIRDHQLSAQSLQALQQQAKASNVTKTNRMHMQFALGMLHERQQQHAQAFHHFAAGNEAHARLYPFDAQAFSQRIERIAQVFDTAFFAQRAGWGAASAKPLFILGMPRSGTSLVEQIIASHPQAHGAGELEDIGHMARELPAMAGGNRRYPQAVARLDEAQVAALAERYLGVVDALGGNALRVTDKMPFNMLWLGLIALLLPQARVIYCRRDAMDNCLSCYFQIFNAGLRFSYDLQHLGQVYRQHERLMAHWQKCLPLHMLTVDYEALVANQEAESRRLLEFAGLSWDERCLQFHTTRRDVSTASTWQVRQPMYKSSVARWRAYEPWLQPLIDSLGG